MLPTIKEWLHETRGVLSTEQGLHDELKDIYIPYTYEQGMSGDRKVYKSTSDLDAVEFADICTKIAADFAEQGLHIPPPDRNWKSIKRAG